MDTLNKYWSEPIDIYENMDTYGEFYSVRIKDAHEESPVIFDLFDDDGHTIESRTAKRLMDCYNACEGLKIDPNLGSLRKLLEVVKPHIAYLQKHYTEEKKRFETEGEQLIALQWECHQDEATELYIALGELLNDSN